MFVAIIVCTLPAYLTYFSHYTSSPGHRVHYYAEFAVSSPAVAETIASTLCAYCLPTEEWPGWVAQSGLNKCWDSTPAKGHQFQY